MVQYFFIHLFLLFIFQPGMIFSIKCCLNNDCSIMKNCSREVSHCIFTGKFSVNKINDTFVKTTEMNLSHFGCWTWTHESNLCPKLIGSCYSVHDSLNYRTFCCAGDFCNNPINLTCEIKKQSVEFKPELFTKFHVSTTLPQPHSDLKGVYIPICVVFVITIIIILLRGMLKKIKLCIRRAFGKRETTYNGLSMQSDRTTCISKVTNDNFSMNQHHMFSEEILKASTYYEKCEKRCLGKFGEIWTGKLVTDPVQGAVENVAVKIFRPRDETSWETEIEMYRYIRNRCSRIVKYIGCDKIIKNNEVVELWLVTQYIERGSLFDCLSNPMNSRPKWSHVLTVCLDIAGGLCYLHEDGSYQSAAHISGKPSIAHRDLKSRNILIRSDWKACIADLGLAVSFHGNRSLNDLHLQVGTQRYMAPEVLEGAINFSRDSFLGIDVYAMALIMWEVFSQCIDFEGLSEINNNTNSNGSCNNNSVFHVTYMQPFEQELGPQITMESLQCWVVNDNRRPQFPVQYSGFIDGHSLWRTIVECWDRDAEARLSSSCVYERLSSLYQKFINSISLICNNDNHTSSVLQDKDPLI